MNSFVGAGLRNDSFLRFGKTFLFKSEFKPMIRYKEYETAKLKSFEQPFLSSTD